MGRRPQDKMFEIRAFGVLCLLVGVHPRAAHATPLDASAQPPRTTVASVPTASVSATPSSTTGISADDLRAIEESFRDASPESPRPPPNPPATPGPRAIATLLPDIALIADTALAWFSKSENLQAGGHDPTENGFTIQQLELAMGSNVDPYFRLDANVVFRPGEVEIEEAYATTLGLPFGLQARVGQMLQRFGRMNATHLHAWAFVDQPFALTRIFGGEGNRGPGLEVSWLTPLPWYVELVGSTLLARGEETARSFIGDGERPIRSPLDLEFLGAIKQFFPIGDDLSLALGVSGATGPGPVFGTRTEVYGLDAYLRYRPVRSASFLLIALETEWLLRRRQLTEDVLEDTSGYAQLRIAFQPRWVLGGRYELGTPAKSRLGVTTDPLDPDWTRYRDRASIVMTFAPTEFSRIRAQGSIDRPRWKEDAIYAAFLAVEVAIGAHGAHAF